MTGARAALAWWIAAVAAAAACGGGGGGDGAPDAGDVDAAPPDAPGCPLDPRGACDGDVLHRCDGDAVVTTDCGATGHACALAGDAYACVDPCELDGGCAADPCDDVGPLGRCAGDELTRCDGGAPVATDCAAAGQVCTYVGDPAGYGCAAPGDVGALRVAGVVRYEDRAPLVDGGLGPLAAARARGARVTVVRDGDGAVLATGAVADDGAYVLHYDAAPGAMVHVAVVAQSTLPARPIRVNRNATQVHGFGAPSFAAAADVTRDVLVTEASGVAQAFNILDQAVAAMDAIRGVLGNPTPAPLTARWARGSNNGTYYSNRTIYLLGASSDDDGYDDTVILHEIGHYVEDTEGRSDSPGGSHDGSPTDPRLAWSEGFSTYFAMAVRGAPHYMDSNAGGGWGYDADTTVTLAPQPGGSMAQPVSEDMVSEILWDLGDGGDGDDDPVTETTHAAPLRVQVEFLRVGPLRAVGASGVDLVDFLDGWFLADGLGRCAAVRAIVTTLRRFPYDYAGPAGACP